MEFPSPTSNFLGTKVTPWTPICRHPQALSLSKTYYTSSLESCLPSFKKYPAIVNFSGSVPKLTYSNGALLRVVSGSYSAKKIPKITTITANCVDSGVKAVEVEPAIGNGGGIGGDKFGGEGGGGGGGNGGGDGNDKGDDGEDANDGKKNTPLSMSQKLTLAYAFLVGVGGLMGYMKSGSQKSLLAGGLSAAVLLYVFRELPTKPVLASTIGVVMAGALTWVMGSRYMGSKKIFPAGVVSLMSFIMTGGYIHGIMRSLH